MAQVFRFIDLFAGIGGIRIAFTNAGGKCVFSSEYEKHSQKTYQAYFGESPDFSNICKTDPSGDITQLRPDLVPSHDILTGGFPCQPFSLAGVSKKQSLGRKHGFDDPTQGTLFFNIKNILKAKMPSAFLLENVKNLISHDKYRTFNLIMKTLDELGYYCAASVIDAAGWVPQHRERIFIVGFRRPEGDYSQQGWNVTNFGRELNRINKFKGNTLDLTDILEPSVPDKYTLGLKTWDTLVRHKKHHEQKGNGFGYGLISSPFKGKVTRTLSARYHKDGAEILIEQGNGKMPRRLTPLECSRLMGFPEDFQRLFSRSPHITQPVADTHAYRQFGNSVVVPVVEMIAKAMLNSLKNAGWKP